MRVTIRSATKKRRQGFSLSDVLMAMVILSTALLSYVGILAQSAQIASKTRAERIAAACAQELVQRKSGGTYGDLITDCDVTEPLSNYYVHPLTNAYVRRVARPLDGNAANSLIREYTVTITWSGTADMPQASGSISAFAVVAVQR